MPFNGFQSKVLFILEDFGLYGRSHLIHRIYYRYILREQTSWNDLVAPRCNSRLVQCWQLTVKQPTRLK